MRGEIKTFRRAVRMFFLITVTAVSINSQNLLAVMDLESDGSVQQADIAAVCDKIAATLSNDSTYMLFDRSMLPELLKQLALDQSATACSDVQCLSLIGSMIGANTVIGGSIRRVKKETEIELKCVDVANKKLINSVSLSSRARKDVLIEKEIPALTESLMAPGSNSIARNTPGAKNIFRNPLTYIGPVLIGGVAAGAWYYKRHYSNEGETGSDPEDTGPEAISLDDAPERMRGGE